MRKLFAALALMLLLSGCSISTEDISSLMDDYGLNEIASEALHGVSEAKKESDHEGKSEESDPEDECYFLKDGTRHAYESLSEEEQIWYDDLERAISSMEESVQLSDEGIKAGLDKTDVEKIYTCIFLDHPEFFYSAGSYSYVEHTKDDVLIGIEVQPNYSYDRDKAVSRKKKIDKAVKKILSGIDEDADDYEKIKYVYEFLIVNTDYDTEASDNQNIYSVFVGKKSVCQGYAKAAQYLLNEMGMECLLVQGTGKGEAHGWNIVKSNGNYYHLDVTWGDAGAQPFSDARVSDFPGEVRYDYLCVTTEEINRNHNLEEIVPLPYCDQKEDNYYVREDLIFTSVDPEKLEQVFGEASEDDRWMVTIKCSSQKCFNEMMKHLIEDGYVHDYHPAYEEQASYSCNEDLWVLTFWVTN